jgi:hypothetical protein
MTFIQAMAYHTPRRQKGCGCAFSATPHLARIFWHASRRDFGERWPHIDARK